MTIRESFELAKKQYEEWGIQVDQMLETLQNIPISIHCWQGDDISGFEVNKSELSGGIDVTGNYPGKARTPEELRNDLDDANIEINDLFSRLDDLELETDLP